MKILMASNSYPPFLGFGGPPLKVQTMARALSERGHRVTVLTQQHGGGSGTTARDAGVEVVYLRVLVAYRSIAVGAGMLPFCIRHGGDFDVAHIFGLYDPMGTTVGYSCRLRKVPYAVEPLGMFKPIMRSRTKKRAYHAFFGGPLLRGASRVVATSEVERTELEASGVEADRVVLRPNGIDLSLYASLPPRGSFRARWAIPADSHLVLFLGRVAPKKRCDLLLRAFAQLPTTAWLAIVGPDEDGASASLMRMAVSLGVEDRVVFTGPVYENSDKVAAFADADVFALTSEGENFGNAAAEAMACGVPVLVSDRCGVSELVRDRAGEVVPLEVGAVEKALRYLLDDAPARARYSTGASEVAAGLGWRGLIDQTEDMYGSMLSGSRD